MTIKKGLRSRVTGHTLDEQMYRDTEGAIATGIDNPSIVERTDFSLWRIKVLHGRQTWHYITPQEAESWPQSIPEKYHLGLETVFPRYS